MFILEKEREWTGGGAEEEWPASSALSVEPNLGSIPQSWEQELSQNQGLDTQLTEPRGHPLNDTIFICLFF